MKRAAMEKPRGETQLKIRMRVLCMCPSQWKNQAGRFRKIKAMDCGNTRCGVCHQHKRFGHQETRQEKLAAMKQADQ